ncbi:ATP-binding cassette domain-containing protein [uncultured Rothia sp.]|uniref:ATP-binding cassette domain-containing protein n=1 Tax=uncultured Rothia sp. TaxID=316088 RepID=UPI003216853E
MSDTNGQAGGREFSGRDLTAAELMAADLNEPDYERARVLIYGERSSGKSATAEKFAARWKAPVQSPNPLAELSGLCSTVAEEIALGLETGVISREELSARVRFIADKLGIDHLLERDPLALSGGQSQLTVLACYLALKPAVLVIDEPFIGLDDDARTRVLEVFEDYEGRLVWTSSRVNPAELALVSHRVALTEERISSADARNGWGEKVSSDSLIPPESLAESVLEVYQLAVSPVARAGATGRLQSLARRLFSQGSKDISDPLIANLKFHVSAGEILALQGPNGSGKSTLLRTLAGLIPSAAGNFTVKGYSLEKLSSPERVKLVSLAAQHPAHHFLTSSVTAEMSLGPAGESPKDFRQELLETIGLADKKDVHPHDLSPVEQHLLAIATALAARPSLLLLDEPTARVDTRGIEQVAYLLERFCASGGAAIVATHDREFLEKIDHRSLRLGQLV